MWRELFIGDVAKAFAAGALLQAAPASATVWEFEAGGVTRLHDVPRSASRSQPKPDRRSTTRPPSGLREALSKAATAREVSADLVEAVAWAESRFNPAARSPAGAVGVMQLMPGTAADLAVDRNSPAQNIAGGTLYLRRLLDRYDGDTVKALAAYNAGPGAVDRYAGVPPYPETQRYVARILGRLAATLSEGTRP